jgi:hypothetical protein
MRKLLFLGAAMLVAAPLAAQPAAYDDDAAYDAPLPQAMADDEEWDEEEDDDGGYGYRQEDRGPPVMHPGQIEAMGGVMDRLLGAVMNLPIGGIAAAVDPYNRGRIHPNATVRDMASRDDPYAEQRLRSGIRGATRGVGAMSQALARMVPVLERSIEQVEREMEAAIDQADIRPR